MHTAALVTAALALGARIADATPHNIGARQAVDVDANVDGYGTCEADTDCVGSWACITQFEGNDRVNEIKTCEPRTKADKRDLAARGDCVEDGCKDGWYCDTVFEGNFAVKPVSVCLPSNKKREVGAQCSSDSDCGDDEFCDEYLTMNTGTLSKAKACYPKSTTKKRSHGNCEEDSDCKKYGSSWTCDTVYSGSATDDVKVCIP